MRDIDGNYAGETVYAMWSRQDAELELEACERGETVEEARRRRELDHAERRVCG